MTSNSVTLEGDGWCQSPSVLGVEGNAACPSGDPAGSTITFSIGDWPDSTLPSSFVSCESSSGLFLFLTQTGNSSGAGFLTNRLVPAAAFFTWHQQARNLASALGDNANDVALLEGSAFTYGVPF